MPALDETDLRILRVMQGDGSLTVTEIAERVGLSQSPCSRRIAALQEKGIIKGRQMILDGRKLGFDTMVIVRVKLQAHDSALIESFRKSVKAIPEIQTALLVLGDFDFYLRIVVRDIEHYQKLLQNQIVSLPGIREMQTSVVLETFKDTPVLPF